MRTDDIKAMARRLRAALGETGTAISHSASLELVARQIGHADWNTAAAAFGAVGVAIEGAIPVLRIFDEAKARAFYLDFLGFRVEFEHRFEPDLPLYLSVERSELCLHLSGHHGDGTPGSTVFVPMTGIAAFQAELLGKAYGFARPGIEEAPWGLMLEVSDPFGNQLRFCEYTED